MALLGVGVLSRGAMGSAATVAGSCRHGGGHCSAAERRLGAIKGGLVADAASMGLHWIYDVNKIKALTKGAHAEFFEPPSCPFYKYEPGQLSPYGAEALGVLRILTDSRDKTFDPNVFAVELKEYFEAYPGRLNHASKELITAIGSGKSFPECGADDSQANSLVKAAIAVTAFEGLDDWALRVDDVMRAHQNNAIAVKYGVGAAHLVRQILNGLTPPPPLHTIPGDTHPKALRSLTPPDEWNFREQGTWRASTAGALTGSCTRSSLTVSRWVCNSTNILLQIVYP